MYSIISFWSLPFRALLIRLSHGSLLKQGIFLTATLVLTACGGAGESGSSQSSSSLSSSLVAVSS